jgi:hypothetical protein
MPVIPDFYASHQWVREIKQYNSGNNIIAVYFKIPDEEMVFCGKYNERLIEAKAAEAHKLFMLLEDKMGFQVIAVRKILKPEITKVKNIPQITGWRHFPKSHERKRCLCPACLTEGSYNSNNTKKSELRRLFKELRNANGDEKTKEILCGIYSLEIRGEAGTRDEKLLNELLVSRNEEIRVSVIDCIAALYGGRYRDYYFETIYNNESDAIADACIRGLIKTYGYKILKKIDIKKCNTKTIEMINEFQEYME